MRVRSRRESACRAGALALLTCPEMREEERTVLHSFERPTRCSAPRRGQTSGAPAASLPPPSSTNLPQRSSNGPSAAATATIAVPPPGRGSCGGARPSANMALMAARGPSRSWAAVAAPPTYCEPNCSAGSDDGQMDASESGRAPPAAP